MENKEAGIRLRKGGVRRGDGFWDLHICHGKGPRGKGRRRLVFGYQNSKEFERVLNGHV